jgi:hypothetical protein
LIVLLAVSQARRPGFSPRLWPVAAAAATFWLLAAFNYIPGREAYASRYMYAGAAFTFLLAADLLRGVRFGRRALIAGALVTIAAAASNLVPLKDGRDWLYAQTVLTRSDLAAIEIAERSIDPNFTLAPDVAGTASLIDIFAGNYLAIAEEDGSPAYTPAELADAPEVGRQQADIVLSQALPLSTKTFPGRPGGGVDCVAMGGAEGQAVSLRPGTTRIEVAPGPPASFSLRRFAEDGFPVPTEGAAGDTTTLLEIPADAAARPWRLRVEVEQGAAVCR